VQRALGTSGDVGQVDLGALYLAELDLGALRSFLQPLAGHLVLRQVDAVLVLELGHQPVDDALIPVVAAQSRVTLGRLDLENALADIQQGDIEGATTKVEDQNRLLLIGLVQAVCQGSRGGLVDNPVDGQPGDLAGFLGGLTFGIAEVGGHGDDSVGDGLTQVGLGVPLQLLQHEAADLLRTVGLAVDFGGPIGAHVTLDRADRPVRVGHGLPLGDLTNQNFTTLGERHY